MQQNWLLLGGDQTLNILVNRKKDILALSICWAVQILVFSRVLFPNQRGIIFGYDVLWLFHPTMSFAFDAFRDGGFPLWNPHIFLGFPQYAEPQLSTFYPMMRAMVWMPAAQAISWLYFLHFGLTASGMYVLARQQGARQTGGLLAALSWSLGSFYIAHLYAGHLAHLMTLAYLPWLLVAGDIAFQSTDWSKAVMAALPLGLAMLAGYAPFFVLLVLTVTVQMIWYTLKTWRSTNSWKRSFVVIRQWMVLGIVGGLIAAVQLLPAIQMALLSTRAASADYEFASQLSLPTWSFATLLIPDLYGSPVGDIYFWKAELFEYWEYALYVGVLPLILLIIALFTNVRRTAFWWLLGSLGLILALGPLGLLHRLAYLLIPGFGLFRVPARFSALFGLSVVIIGGVTIDHLSFRKWRWSRYITLLMIISSLTFLSIAVYASLLNVNILQQAYSGQGLFWMLFLLTAFISLLLLRDVFPSVLWTVCLIGLVIIDLSVWGYRFIAIETEIAYGWQVAHAELPADRSLFRVDSSGLRGNQAMLYGFQHVGGYDEFRLESSKRFGDLREKNDSLEQMLGVQYRAQDEKKESPADGTWHAISSSGGVNLFERNDVFPRAFVVYDVIGVEDLESALIVLADRRHNWWETAVVEVAPNTSCTIGNPQSAASVTVIKYEPDEIKLQVQTDATGWLVVTDQHYPGWQATIDGQQAPIQVTNAALRGLCIPAGSHDIVFSFRPILLPFGSALSLLGILLLIIAGIVQIKHRRSGRLSRKI